MLDTAANSELSWHLFVYAESLQWMILLLGFVPLHDNFLQAATTVHPGDSMPKLLGLYVHSESISSKIAAFTGWKLPTLFATPAGSNTGSLQKSGICSCSAPFNVQVWDKAACTETRGNTYFFNVSAEPVG